jgi:hypothetical protein
MRSSIRTAATVALTATLAVLTFGLDLTKGSCAAPTIELESADQRRLVVEAGQSLEVIGRYWTLDCFDSSSVNACGRTEQREQRPMKHISIVLRRGSDPESAVQQTLILAEGLRSDRSFEFRVSVELPAHLRKGGWSLFARSDGFTTGPYLLMVR